ncbi:hypothetical protein V6N11_072184 [Hibiscus sabdariffa]|uniref:Uncharacterized protein n=1 Tax=Hibiscus sabdariffa TaxID=183260 RepID=A0ABR2U2B2_9ROSI
MVLKAAAARPDVGVAVVQPPSSFGMFAAASPSSSSDRSHEKQPRKGHENGLDAVVSPRRRRHSGGYFVGMMSGWFGGEWDGCRLGGDARWGLVMGGLGLGEWDRFRGADGGCWSWLVGGVGLVSDGGVWVGEGGWQQGGNEWRARVSGGLGEWTSGSLGKWFWCMRMKEMMN